MTAAGSSQPITQPSTAPPALESSVHADLANLSPSRSEVDTWLTGCLHQQEVNDIVLVFNELLANAIDAAAPQDMIRYRVESDAASGVKQTRVTVTNFRVETGWINTCPMPEPDAERGRGLAIAEMYSDKLEILVALDRVEVSATFTSAAFSNLLG